VYRLSDRKMRHLNEALGAAVTVALLLLGLSSNADLDKEN
jgi:hypothetical protein